MLAARRITKALSHGTHMQVGHDWGTELSQLAADLTLLLPYHFTANIFSNENCKVAMLVKRSNRAMSSVAESAGLEKQEPV